MLNLPDCCPRCFWLILRSEGKFPFQIPMPGIFSSIDGYSKNLIHTYFDSQKVLPSWFPNIGKVVGYLPGYKLHWSKFKTAHPETRIVLRGTPDDVFSLDDGSYHIVDYKTAKATEKQDELFPAYEVQLNVYAFIGASRGFSPVSGLSLVYMEPKTEINGKAVGELIQKDFFSLRFSATLKKVQLTAEKLVPDLLVRARKILDCATPPKGRDHCKDCELLLQLLRTTQAGGITI